VTRGKSKEEELERGSLDAIFRPRSVAVVGTSREPDSIGRKIMENIVAFGFEGVVFPVNPAAEVVSSMKCYPSVGAIPDPVDLAILCVPHRVVPDVIRDCAAKGVRGLAIISAGFKEIGEEGAVREREVLRLARQAGMRLIGPNCMGIVNAEESCRLDATFATYLPLPGNVSFISQSGALGEAILAHCRHLGIGIHMFCSLGNRADISANDLLEYWEDDPATGVILLYLESFGNPHRFPAIARRVARKKPMIAVKSGVTAAGARAATSHTGALAASKDITFDTLFEQTGILRVHTLEGLLRLASAFATQPLPQGPRVAIVTNAGGPGILATDTCVNLGLEVPELAEETQEHLSKFLAAEASTTNPVDMIAIASADDFREAILTVRKDPGVDALLVIAVCIMTMDDVHLARCIADGLEGVEVPVLSCFMGKALSRAGSDILRARDIPVFDFPESAAQALAAMWRHKRFRDRPEGEVRTFEVDREAAAAVIDAVRGEGRRQLGLEEVQIILEAYGIPFAEGRKVTTLEEAIAAARDMGFPVVLKFLEPGLVHKTEAAAVHVDLGGMEEMLEAWEAGRRSFPDCPVLVQKMMTAGREVVLGMAEDPNFGPLMMFGLGGIHVEALGDVVFRIHPLTDLDAREMIQSIKGAALLEEFRGAPAADRDHLLECILRLSQLVEDFPDLDEIEINPFLAAADPALSVAVDARARLSAPAPAEP
jgi:acetyl coenzyme A synthetase (ADP forming)-like protein